MSGANRRHKSVYCHPIHTARTDNDSPRSVLGLPVQVSSDGSAWQQHLIGMSTDSKLEHCDHLHYDDARNRLARQTNPHRGGAEATAASRRRSHRVIDLDNLSACQHTYLDAALCTEVVTDHPSELQSKSNGGDCLGCGRSADVVFESPSPPAPDGASASARTYDDITKSPPLHLRCVVSPLCSLLLSGAPPHHYHVFLADVPE